MTATSTDPPARSQPDTSGLVAPVCEVLLACLGSLAAAGETDAACRLAGRAYVLLRHAEPEMARRFDRLLHRLTPALTWDEPPHRAGAAASRG